MNWKVNPRTGQMEPKISPSAEIQKKIIPVPPIEKWISMRTVREGVKICYNKNYYLAMCFNGQWRLLGIIADMPTIEKYLRGPLVNFHDAWLRGHKIDEPEFN